jgi:hypothetical protein
LKRKNRKAIFSFQTADQALPNRQGIIQENQKTDFLK